MAEEIIPQSESKQGETGGILGLPLPIPVLTSLRKGGFILYGIGTLSSGVLTITDNRIKTTSVALAVYHTSGGTMGSTLRAVCTAGVLTITSMKTAGTASLVSGVVTYNGTAANTSDTSTVNYMVIF